MAIQDLAMESISLRNYFTVFKRRKINFFVIAIVIFFLACAFAFFWPPQYRSEATIEIDQPDIPSNITAPVGQTQSDALEAFANQRIQQVAQRILTTSNLVDIVSKFNLYEKERETTPISSVVGRMRSKIKVHLANIDIGGGTPAGGTPSVIAFTISFDYNEPLPAQQVDNELVNRFLEEDLHQRQQQVDVTSDFLAKQIGDMEVSLAEQEKKMSAFRSEHAGSRSEDLAFNMQGAASTAQTLDSLSQQLSAIQQQRGSIQASLASTYPYSTVFSAASANGTITPTLTSPAMQLKSLQAQYAALQGQYGPQYPDVVRLHDQIAALEAYLHGGMDSAGINAEIIDVESRLAVARKTYGPNYPDVHNLEHELEGLKNRARDIIPNTIDPLNIKDADSPSYLVLKTSLNALENQEKVLLAEQAQARQQHEVYSQRVAEAPAVERDFSVLSRDYENAQLRYRDLKEKKMAADMNQQLQKNRNGERLVMIEAPQLPGSPHFPNRSIVIALGVVLAFFGGLGGVHLAEALSVTVHGSDHLVLISGSPPLAVIPRILSPADIRQRRVTLLLALSGTLVFVIVSLVLISAFVMPLDVLWAIVERKF